MRQLSDIDTGLTQEDEDEIRDMMKEILKEQYPELLTEGSAGNTDGTRQYVGTEDNTANTRQIQIGESGQDEIDKCVTVY